MKFFVVFGLIFLHTSAGFAAETDKPALPDPLTLSKALSFAEQPHPDLSVANLNVQSAINLKQQAESANDLNAYLEGRLQYIEPSPIAVDQNNDNNRAGIIISKTLYDSGRASADINSGKFNIRAEKVKRQRIINERRIEIMQKFFDVILADMNFYRYNEQMATAFVSLDKLRDRQELGQTSDIEVMKQDVEYQKVRYLRIRSQNEQRITRARLAIAMGRPGELVNTISKPALTETEIKLPDVEQLNKIAWKNNYRLITLQAKLAAARAKVDFAKKTNSPTVNLEAASYAYSHERRRNDELQLGLVLRVPLFAGTHSDIAVAKALNKVHRIEADIELLKTDISASILTLYLEYDSLKGKIKQMQALKDYRELYLDRSRALYELEVKTDLGDAMVLVSAAQRDYLSTRYQMMLVLARLELLLGKKLQDITKGTEQ